MRTQPTQRPSNPSLEYHAGAPLAKLLPELSMFACVAWILFAPDAWVLVDYDALLFAGFADVATLMLSGTLIDVASRLRRAPPWWAAPLVLVAVLLLYPEAWDLLKLGWSLGFWILLPFAWSMLERIREIWTLPSASTLEKIRRRVLTFDRLYTALALLGGCVAVVLLSWLLLVLLLGFPFEQVLDERYLPWLMLLFYAINSVNAVRVHRPAFAAAPRSLWPRQDQGEATTLTPL